MKTPQFKPAPQCNVALTLRRSTARISLVALSIGFAGCASGPDVSDDTTTLTPETDGTTETTTETTDPTGVIDDDGDGVPDAFVGPGGIKLTGMPEYFSFVRLTHEQWENSIRDMFGSTTVTGDVADTLYPDPPSGTFGNNESGLYVGSELFADYVRAADQIAEAVVKDTAAVTALGGLSNSGEFIEKLGHRAFRRPLTAEETAKYQALWEQGATFYASGDAGADGARTFIRAILQSPFFEYRIETADPGTRLSGPEIATKLSFLLLNTTPNDELLEAAENGELDTDEGLSAVVTSMLGEEGATAALLEFHSQLYGLNRYKNIQKSVMAFPTYTETVKDSLEAADRMFFEKMYEDDGGFRDILSSPVAYVNRDIARYYGLSSNSTELSEVTLDATRPGFLTRVGFLTYNATLSEPDPIHRGVDINLRMLCEELSPPSGTIPPLPAPVPNQSNRERVEAHTGEAVCATCHEKIINPLGFAFENFDAMGQERTEDAGKPVNTVATYEFNDGEQTFNDARELIGIMTEHQQTHACYSAKLTEYLLGRDVSTSEMALVTNVFDSSFSDAASIKQLVLTAVLDPMFTHAQTGAQQ